MNMIVLEAVTNASLRDKQQLTQFAVDQASAGAPWLDKSQ